MSSNKNVYRSPMLNPSEYAYRRYTSILMGHGVKGYGAMAGLGLVSAENQAAKLVGRKAAQRVTYVAILGGRIGARAVPYLGWGLLAYDTVRLGRWAINKRRERR